MVQIKTISLLILILFISNIGLAQISPNHYLINFIDKKNSKYSINKPEKFLSQRSIARRLRYNIPINSNDLPVNQSYIDKLNDLGLKIVNVSKWLNSACVYSVDSALLDTLHKYPFVKSVGFDKKKESNKKKNLTVKSQLKQFGIESKDSSLALQYGDSYTQIKLHNGQLIHQSGYQGQGIQIAILDGGFYKVNELPAFDSLRLNNQILGTRDFVDGDLEVYDAATHGMMVLSTMAGNIPGKLLGTAPKASYWLLRTEQTESEYMIEEYNWVAAAEFADSVGVDLINSSLGYNNFDDTNTSHIYADMDGNTTLISRGADIAASVGILVVTSAGNEGSNNWRYISAPADADSVLTIGAIMKDSRRAYFSSYGPSSDKRIKPDVCALGLPSVVSGASGQVTTSSGTSFSSPIMAGLVACLWQAHPKLNNMEIIEIIKRSASQFSKPDTSLGYGIPDIYSAHIFLNTMGYNDKKAPESINVFPNPFKNSINVEFLSKLINIPYDMNIELFDTQGRMIWNKEFHDLKNNLNMHSIEELESLQNGLYIIRLTANDIVLNKKVMKY